MSREAQLAMRKALKLGPDYCPPDLFQGEIVQVVLGLGAYANNIAAARMKAMEASFPRTRAFAGDEEFRGAVELHTIFPEVLNRPLRAIGQDFERMWAGAARDLAAAEWAWLQAYEAVDEPALALADFAALSEAELLELSVCAHPAAQLVLLHCPADFHWEGAAAGHYPMLLIARPEAAVTLTRLPAGAAGLWELLQPSATLGALLERDPALTTQFIESGALSAGESTP